MPQSHNNSQDVNKPELAHNEALDHRSESEDRSLIISDYTKALVNQWQAADDIHSLSPNKISVSQTVSFIAFIYEKMRNAVEFREEHLIRRSSIERIIKRRMLLNENGRDISEVVIKELLWARYYENNTIGEEKIPEIQSIIDKYFFIRNEISRGRTRAEQEKIGAFMLEVLSCEIEDRLSPSTHRDAFTNFAYQILRTHIHPYTNSDSLERDIQVYIGIEKAFTQSDLPLIRYNLLKLMLPDIASINWKSAEKILPQIYDVFQKIEKSLEHPLGDKMRSFITKQSPPFLILKDIFSQYSRQITSILADEKLLKERVDEACRKRYDETRVRLRRTGIRSFIYIILTKVIFAFLLELPYDLYVIKSISYVPIFINILFPPFLMGIIIATVSVPGDENTRKIYNLIKDIITIDPNSPEALEAAVSLGKKTKVKSPIFSALFSLLYLLTYLISFGSIIYVLTLLDFNPVSQSIFIFFITLVTFFAYRVIAITKEYLVVDREGFFTPLVDFFFLPIIKVGQWLSAEVLTKFNVLIFLFDFIIEMPLKAIVEVVDEWVKFVKLKKEEMV